MGFFYRITGFLLKPIFLTASPTSHPTSCSSDQPSLLCCTNLSLSLPSLSHPLLLLSPLSLSTTLYLSLPSLSLPLLLLSPLSLYCSLLALSLSLSPLSPPFPSLSLSRSLSTSLPQARCSTRPCRRSWAWPRPPRTATPWGASCPRWGSCTWPGRPGWTAVTQAGWPTAACATQSPSPAGTAGGKSLGCARSTTTPTARASLTPPPCLMPTASEVPRQPQLPFVDSEACKCLDSDAISKGWNSYANPELVSNPGPGEQLALPGFFSHLKICTQN